MNRDNSNAIQFLDAFNDIEARLRLLAKADHYVSFNELLKRTRFDNTVIKRYANDLREYAELRNAIVHTRREDFIIAEPHPSVVSHICRVRDQICNPPTVSSLKSKPVFVVNPETPMRDVLTQFAQRNFVRCPVVDQGRIVCLLTAKSITRWLASTGLTDQTKIATVSNVIPFALSEKYIISTPETDIYSVYENFKLQLRSGGSLQAVLITRKGDNHGPVIQMITASDLPALFDLLEKGGHS